MGVGNDGWRKRDVSAEGGRLDGGEERARWGDTSQAGRSVAEKEIERERRCAREREVDEEEHGRQSSIIHVSIRRHPSIIPVSFQYPFHTIVVSF